MQLNTTQSPVSLQVVGGVKPFFPKSFFHFVFAMLLVAALNSMSKGQNVFPDNGYVGIYNSSPQYPLDVNGFARFWEYAIIRSTDGTVYLRASSDPGAQENILYSTNGDGQVSRDFHIWGSTATADININNFSVYANNARFNGSIFAKKLKITTNPWADFVFEPDYQLMSLSEVEAYIKNYKHLPDIPAAIEIKEKGLDVGQMQQLHMQKIEELTLYVIELEKRIQALEGEKTILAKGKKHKQPKK